MNWGMLTGKTVEMFVEGMGKVTCHVTDVKDGALIIQSKGREYICPVEKVGIHRIITPGEAKHQQVVVYMCKNDSLACRGVKLLRAIGAEAPSLVTMPCEQEPTKREGIGCEFAKVGNLYDLPPDIQNRFLNGLHTGPGPISEPRAVEPPAPDEGNPQ
jgi:hypothetical protein